MSEPAWKALLKEASALRGAGRVAEAIAAYQRLLDANPDLPASWYNLGWLQKQARQFEDALTSYRQALDRGASDPEEIHLNRAVILADHLGRPEEALTELESALALNPGYVPALLNLGNLHEDRGDKPGARAAYERALSHDPANALALARLAGVSDAQGADDPLVERLRKAIGGSGNAVEQADLGFALGRVLDQAGDFDAAFEAYSRANRASAASRGPAFRGYDRRAHEQFVDRLIATFPEPAEQRPASRGRAPLFICGLFRSGSTLIEQILAGHSGVTAGGELDLLPALIAAHIRPYPEALAGAEPAALDRLREAYLQAMPTVGGRGIVTDKRPDNFLHIGLIKALFPEARIVHTVRNPLDNLLSLYFLHLDPAMAYALDLEDAAHWHGEYRRLMTHWKRLYPADILDLDYDELVRDPRPAVERLLAFTGLEWEDSVLDFHSGRGVVKTASVWQVREPLYTRSSGRWKNYERQLRPLIQALENG